MAVECFRQRGGSQKRQQSLQHRTASYPLGRHRRLLIQTRRLALVADRSEETLENRRLLHAPDRRFRPHPTPQTENRTIFDIPDKPRLFSECYRVLETGGQIGFYTLYFEKELEPGHPEYNRAKRWRTDQPYETLLKEAGFNDVTVIDYTEAHIQLAKDMIESMTDNRDVFEKEFGKDLFEVILVNQIAVWTLAEHGYTKKALFKATK